MGFLGRKMEEGASGIYRSLIYPFVRAATEIKTDSIMKQKSYLKRTVLYGKNYVGKGAILKDCSLGFGSYVQSGCDFTDTDIGKYTCIGSNVRTVIGSHPTKKLVAMHPAFNDPDAKLGYSYAKEKTYEDAPKGRTCIGNDVWIGNNVLIMGGVSIGDGAVIGAGALVIKDVKPYSVNVGVPAGLVRYRFEEEEIERLLNEKWWDKDEKWIMDNIDRFADIEDFFEC